MDDFKVRIRCARGHEYSVSSNSPEARRLFSQLMLDVFVLQHQEGREPSFHAWLEECGECKPELRLNGS